MTTLLISVSTIFVIDTILYCRLPIEYRLQYDILWRAMPLSGFVLWIKFKMK